MYCYHMHEAKCVRHRGPPEIQTPVGATLSQAPFDQELPGEECSVQRYKLCESQGVHMKEPLLQIL